MSTAELRAWLTQAPEGTLVPAAAVLELLSVEDQSAPLGPIGPNWRERIWTCPEDTRLSVSELADAIGRPVSWVYRHTSAKAGYRIIPHAKIDNEITFRAGDVRVWIRESEDGTVRTTQPAEARVLAIGRKAR